MTVERFSRRVRLGASGYFMAGVRMDLTLIGALAVAVTTLAGVVTYMGNWFLKHFDELKAEVRECRSDRESLWRDRDQLWQKVAEISSKIER